MNGQRAVVFIALVTILKESASNEPAWNNSGQAEGLQIWRIVNLTVTDLPIEEYGKFYDGDSYIILNTYKYEDTEELNYDVHFWIGEYSTEDEYESAAWQTVALDKYLDNVPVQHREVMAHESELFKSYFKSMTFVKGGEDSNLKHVNQSEYKQRLFRLHGDRDGVKVCELPCNKKLLNDTDVYILNLGLKLYQWNGEKSNKKEKMTALRFLKRLAKARGGMCKTEILDQDPKNEDNEFYDALTDDDIDDSESCENKAKDTFKRLFRLTDSPGTLKMKKEKEESITLKDFDSQDVFIFDTSDAVFVWIGNKTTQNEKINAMIYTLKYLMITDHPLSPITSLAEGEENESFQQAVVS